MKKGGSGLYLNANDKEAFEHFVNNSTTSFLTTGSFGITYTLTLNPGVQSKYLSLDASTYSQPVNKLILKTTFIYPLEIQLKVTLPDGTKENKKSTSMENFYEEVNIQTDTYLKTMKYLEPICPAIVYATAFNWDNPFMHFITNSYPPDLIQQLVSYPGIKIGLIAMEIVSNARILYNYMHEKAYYESYVPKAFFTLIEFIIQTGYNHGDFHASNFLVNDSIKNYFWGRTGKVSIIDFGFAEKLSQDMYKKIKQLYDQQRYVDILTLLCDIPRKDGYNLNDWAGYTVMCLKRRPQLNDARNYVVDKMWMNNQISILFSQREQSINLLVKSFTAKKLPLSNRAKNEMYNGVHLQKEFIKTLEPIPSTNPFMQKNTKIDIINTIIAVINDMITQLNVPFSITQQTRIWVKTLYIMHYIIYKLGNNYINLNNILFTAMIYSNVFYKISNDFNNVIFLYRNTRRMQDNSIGPPDMRDAEEIKKAISIGFSIDLEYREFYCFIDYLTDNEVNNLTQIQILDLFQSNKITNITSRVLADELKTSLGTASRLPSTNISLQKGFEELPFNETETIVVETTNSSDVLPRPMFVNKRFEGWPKITAGKIKKNTRKPRKYKLIKSQKQKNQKSISRKKR